MNRSFAFAAVFAASMMTAWLVPADAKAQTPPDKASPQKTPEAETPPSGWKEYSPKDKTFRVWVPEKVASQSEKERTLTVKAKRYRVNTLTGKTRDGLFYQAETIVLPAGSAPKTAAAKKDLYDAFRDAFATEIKGDVKDTKKADLGGRSGYEYLIAAGDRQTRMRMLLGLSRIWIVNVSGSEDQVKGKDAETFLESYRLTGAAAKEEGDSAEAGKGGASAAPKKAPAILGGAFDPQFKDMAPAAALLIGFEIGTENSGNRDWIRAVRPIYLAGEKETFGEQFGKKLPTTRTVKAKAGYAVGAINAKHGLGFDGMSVTFMKIDNDKLDPKDAYESDWVGTDEKKRTTKLGGDGTPVIGIVGKQNLNDKRLTGMGLLFKGQEAFDPTEKK